MFKTDVGKHIDVVETFLRELESERTVSSIAPLWSLRVLQDRFMHTQEFDKGSVCAELELRILNLHLNPKPYTATRGLLELSQLLRQSDDESADEFGFANLLSPEAATSL